MWLDSSLPALIGSAIAELAAKMMGPAQDTQQIMNDDASCTVYVGNLDPQLSAQQLGQFFSAVCGEVLHTKMAGESTHVPLPFVMLLVQATVGQQKLVQSLHLCLGFFMCVAQAHGLSH